MKTTLRLSALSAVYLAFSGVQAASDAAPSNAAPQASAVYRMWTDTLGRKVEATFRGVENGFVFLQTKNGYVYRLELAKLSAADQEAAKTLKPEGLGIPRDPNLAQAAARIDFFVDGGLAKAGQKANPLASDEQFVRRVYLDAAGRIPTREEALAFITDTSVSKRAKLIDQLLDSDGYKSHLFNYLADMLRIADEANKGRFYTYQEWLKGEVAKNTSWDKIVYQMMTAEGKLLDNGATGYLVRDAGMRLDNMSLTLSTFLGANVACAQCHDHPFADWTQKQFYQMASFMGASETYSGRGKAGASMMDFKTMRQALRSIEDKRLQQFGQNIARLNAMSVHTTDSNDLVLPDDYKYEDAKPGDAVAPQLITWTPQDRHLRCYQDVKAREPEQLRHEFAKWMTAPDNPRFAMTIANRMWKRAFGIAVREPVHDLDDPNASSNPPLLHHLASEMVRVKFDLRAFMRLVYNTQAYQREATTYEPEAGTPYLFQGPTLRRMTAEQAWDSCVALAVGDKLDVFKNKRAEKYSSAMQIDFANTSNLEEQLRNAQQALRSANAIAGGKAKAKAKAKGKKRMMMQDVEDMSEAELATRPPTLGGMVLARASELPQPEKDQHFLRQFGQSDRQIADSSSDEGNIPQVLMLMNGDAQSVISSNRSLAVKTAYDLTGGRDAQIESLYISAFSRKPRAEEIATAKEALDGGLGLTDLMWALFNTREFMFVE